MYSTNDFCLIPLFLELFNPEKLSKRGEGNKDFSPKARNTNEADGRDDTKVSGIHFLGQVRRDLNPATAG